MNLVQRLLLITLFAVSGCSAGAGTPVLVGKRAPLASLYMLNGEQVSLASYRGKTTVLIFWVHWCSHCKEAIKQLNAFARSSSAPDAVFIGVNVDKQENFSNVKKTISQLGLNSLAHAFSGNEFHDEAFVAFGLGEVPTLFVIDPEGKIVAQGTHFGIVEEYFSSKS